MPWLRLVPVLVGERRRIVAGEAMVGELRPHRIALLAAHRAVDAVDRKKRQRIGADERAHAFEVVIGGQELVALGRIDAVIVGMVIGGDAMRMCTSRAPASRIICTIFTEVVPRTIESSISTMRLPATTARLALCLRRTPSARMCCVGSMKVRPT